jgi:hypothetical protein
LVTATELTADPAQVGRFRATISDDWTIVHVFGGVSMYTALRAMSMALGHDDQSPLTSTALFLAPIPAGALTVDVDILRSGRTTSQLAADVRVPGSSNTALRLQAVLGVPRMTELRYEDIRCPHVPRPNEVPVRRHSPTVRFNFDDRTEWRPISGFDVPHSKKILSWERLLVGRTDLLSLALHSDILGIAVERLGPIYRLVVGDWDPLRGGANNTVGTPGDRVVERCRRMCNRPRSTMGRRRAALRRRHSNGPGSSHAHVVMPMSGGSKRRTSASDGPGAGLRSPPGM